MGWSTECITLHHCFSIVMVFTSWFGVKFYLPKSKISLSVFSGLSQTESFSISDETEAQLQSSANIHTSAIPMVSPGCQIQTRNHAVMLAWSCPWAHKPHWEAEALSSDVSTMLRPLLLYQNWLTSRQLGEQADQSWDHLHPSVQRHSHHC